MGIRAEIQAELTAAMNDAEGLGDTVETIEFLEKTGESAYDPVTDTTSPTYTPRASRGIFKKIDSRAVNGNEFQLRDEVIIVNGTDVTIVPDIDMKVRTADGREYIIVNPVKIPGGASTAIVWKIQVRRTND